MAKKKVLVIGLDCATPQLVFDKYKDKLPNINSLINGGIYGEMMSSIPPITCPAWMCMMTSKNPGKLGFYGFRNRIDYSYDKMVTANSESVKEDTVWQTLSKLDKYSIVVGVPQTYPIKRVNGVMISCFLTPNTDVQFTHPITLKKEIEAIVGEYIVDCKDFRTNDKDKLLEGIYEMTEKRFKVMRYLLRTRPWDFAMMVEMGIDRIHHAFWKYCDPEHPKYEAGNKYENAILDYYIYVDNWIGELLKYIDDDTAVMIVSDHGAQKMVGGICINEWLIKEGYLKLKKYPETPVSLEKCEVDWANTKAWSSGGYYARLFINVKGREPNGVIEQSDYERFRNELVDKLEALPDHEGNHIGTRCIKPEDAYPEINSVPPDLIIYPGNLNWRAVGTVGLNEIYTFENDTGPDDANHAEKGIFILNDKSKKYCDKKGEKVDGITLYNVAPTILKMLDVEIPKDYEGKPLI